jgi:hypothetical protein
MEGYETSIFSAPIPVLKIQRPLGEGAVFIGSGVGGAGFDPPGTKLVSVKKSRQLRIKSTSASASAPEGGLPTFWTQ